MVVFPATFVPLNIIIGAIGDAGVMLASPVAVPPPTPPDAAVVTVKVASPAELQPPGVTVAVIVDEFT